MTTVLNPRDKLSEYRCCTQTEPGKDVVVRSIHSDQDEQVYNILSKMSGRPLDQLSFCEVHKREPGSNKVSIILPDERPWPKGVPIRSYGGAITLKQVDNAIDEDRIRTELNTFFENNKPQVPALPAPLPRQEAPKEPAPHTLPLIRYTLKVA